MKHRCFMRVNILASISYYIAYVCKYNAYLHWACNVYYESEFARISRREGVGQTERKGERGGGADRGERREGAGQTEGKGERGWGRQRGKERASLVATWGDQAPEENDRCNKNLYLGPDLCSTNLFFLHDIHAFYVLMKCCHSYARHDSPICPCEVRLLKVYCSTKVGLSPGIV